MAAEHHVYAALEAPDVEVEHDGKWWPGEARMRTTHRDGTVTYQVQYRTDNGTHLDVFPTNRVRLDQTDYSRGG